jgi:hypothetical protein
MLWLLQAQQHLLFQLVLLYVIILLLVVEVVEE